MLDGIVLCHVSKSLNSYINYADCRSVVLPLLRDTSQLVKMLSLTSLKAFILTIATVAVAQDASTNPYVAPGAGDGNLPKPQLLRLF
jgi:hypothetical protein